jgi:hypothetical protein
MARRPKLELGLLLLVAPLLGGCDRDPGPEARRCVGPDGRYVEDGWCEPAHSAYRPGYHYIYVPSRHYTGIGSSAGHFTSATTPGSGRSAAISRGGFGSTGHHAAGGG